MSRLDERSWCSEIREVTDQEVQFFNENGWVMLRGLFSANLALELLRIGKKLPYSASVGSHELDRAWGTLALNGSELFGMIALSERMGRAAQRLINRVRLTDNNVPTRYMNDGLRCRRSGGPAAAFHQDYPGLGGDRVGQLAFWVALDEVTPEMGAMSFLTGSHRLGPLGNHVTLDPDRSALLAAYPKLPEICEASQPFHYAAGDATVHDGLMVHGSPPNRTDRERWSWILNYSAADVRYQDGMLRNPEENFATPSDTRHPIVYPAKP